jgi:hypothetical protein
MRLFFNIIVLLIIIGQFSHVHAQSAMTFEELKPKIEKYFDPVLIADIKSELPTGSSYRIWGWDVGDFSGDGFYDLAFAVKKFSSPSHKIHVFMFVDIEGFLVKVAEIERDFLEIPLEVGIVIRDNACYVTEKSAKYHWSIKSYRYDDGVLALFDEFKTAKVNKYTHETYRNFSDLTSSEKVIRNSNGRVELDANYLTLPCYERPRQFLKSYNNEIFSGSTDFVSHGAYDRQDWEDVSFYAKSAYDSRYLYFSVKVIDEQVVVPSCQDCTSDYIDLWLEMEPRDGSVNRLINKFGNEMDLRKTAKSGIFRLSVYLGDFAEEKAHVFVSSSDDLSLQKRNSASEIRVASKQVEGGYVVKFRVPFSLFGLDSPPFGENELSEWGCSFVVHDIDNEFRPEEETEISSSKFQSGDPSSYGSLIFIGEGQWYGKSQNIYADKILDYIREYGL